LEPETSPCPDTSQIQRARGPSFLANDATSAQHLDYCDYDYQLVSCISLDAPALALALTLRLALRTPAELGLIPGLQPRTVDATEPRTVEISVPLATGEHIV
jgi:hypothetical protein